MIKASGEARLAGNNVWKVMCHSPISWLFHTRELTLVLLVAFLAKRKLGKKSWQMGTHLSRVRMRRDFWYRLTTINRFGSRFTATLP